MEAETFLSGMIDMKIKKAGILAMFFIVIAIGGIYYCRTTPSIRYDEDLSPFESTITFFD